MQTTKKSKIFLSVLFLVALFFVSCSFEDILGTNGRNTGGNYTGSGETGGGGSSGGTSGGGSSGGNGSSGGSSGKNDGSSIPKTYHGKYTKAGNMSPTYIIVGNDSKGDYIMQEGGSKKYVKDFVYDSAENTWRQVSPYGYQSSQTLQYILKTEGTRKTLIFRIIRTYIPKNSSTTNIDFTYFL